MPEVIDMGNFSISETTAQNTPSAQSNAPPFPRPNAKGPPMQTLKQEKNDVKIVTKHFQDVANEKTPDLIKEHQEHVLMLSRYGSSQRFGPYLKSMALDLKVATLKKKKIDELKELLERVRTTVANKTVSDVWSDTILGGLTMTENVVKMAQLPIKLDGLSQSLQSDETFLDLLEELRLENQNLSYVSPYVRISYMILTTGARVHAMNSMLDRHKQKKLGGDANVTVDLKSETKSDKKPESKSKASEDEKIIKTKPDLEVIPEINDN